MLFTFRTHVQILFQVFFPDDRPAALTLHPQAFGANSLLPRRLEFPGFTLEPSHKVSCQYQVPCTESSRTLFSVPGTQYSIPFCAITPFSYACFTCRISVTVSAASTNVGCAFL